VKDALETKRCRHERSDVEDEEAADDGRRKRSPRESSDHVSARLTCPASTELRATPHPHAISPPRVGRQGL
jgi:hypothetical protein